MVRYAVKIYIETVPIKNIFAIRDSLEVNVNETCTMFWFHTAEPPTEESVKDAVELVSKHARVIQVVGVKEEQWEIRS